MKITYSISIDDFRALQKPLVPPGTNKFGLKAMWIFCGLVAALGVFTAFQGLGAPIAIFLFCLGSVAAVAAYFYDGHSQKKAQLQYEKNIVLAYGKVHCRNERVLVLSPDFSQILAI